MWTNITDEDIENADDEVMSPDEGMGDLMGMGGGDEPQKAHTQDYAPSQPRNSDGTFGNKGGSKRKNKYRREKKRGTIRLSKKEYAQVVSDINTHMPKVKRESKFAKWYCGDYCYTFVNNGFDEYEFIDKKKIK